MFTGDKRCYRNWKAAFMACVDTVPCTGEYKLLQLRQCLSGEALNVIESLGYLQKPMKQPRSDWSGDMEVSPGKLQYISKT